MNVFVHEVWRGYGEYGLHDLVVGHDLMFLGDLVFYSGGRKVTVTVLVLQYISLRQVKKT